MDITVVVPLFNEEESLPELYAWIERVMKANDFSFEVIFVNDGSTDHSWEVIEELAEKSANVKGIKFRRNYGKSPALFCGFKEAHGDVVITMDADLQDSPDEIPALYHMITKEGYDLVSGYKQNRKQIHDELETHARELLAQMGLSDRAGHYPHQLSGGQQQRVAIARALALHPDILCFDEPTSALDPELTGEVLRVLRDLAEHKTTMIIVTHEMKFARDVADRILFMDGGVVVEQGDAKQVIDHPQEERTRKFLASYGK